MDDQRQRIIDAREAFQAAEGAYHAEAAKYLVIADATQPLSGDALARQPERIFDDAAAAELTRLRQSVADTQGAWYAAVRGQ